MINVESTINLGGPFTAAATHMARSSAARRRSDSRLRRAAAWCAASGPTAGPRCMRSPISSALQARAATRAPGTARSPPCAALGRAGARLGDHAHRARRDVLPRSLRGRARGRRSILRVGRGAALARRAPVGPLEAVVASRRLRPRAFEDRCGGASERDRGAALAHHARNPRVRGRRTPDAGLVGRGRVRSCANAARPAAMSPRIR